MIKLADRTIRLADIYICICGKSALALHFSFWLIAVDPLGSWP